MFEAISNEIDTNHSDLCSWASGQTAEAFAQRHKLSKAALAEIKNLYEKTGSSEFVKLVRSAVMEDTNSPNLADLFCRFDGVSRSNNTDETDQTIRDLEKCYYEALFNFNRIYLASILDKVPMDILIRFLIEQIGVKGLSLEFINRIKLHPDAPCEIRDSLRLTGKTKKDFTEEDRLTKDKEWYDDC